jgi:D-alanyl-D-alanine carboxypeptidase (penicillin-binding protein 5/6)
LKNNSPRRRILERGFFPAADLRKRKLPFYYAMTMRRIFQIFAVLLFVSLGFNASAATKKRTTSSSSAAAKRKAAEAAETSAPRAVPEPPKLLPNGVPVVRASSVVVLDAKTGEILYEKNADQRRPPASTQKLLTTLIIAESGNLERTVTVQPEDTWAEPVKLNFQPGEVYRRFDLLQVLLVHSMNDVALCLARDNAGSIEAFADKMNRKAAQLGMTNSHFVNPNGLPVPDQYSTARDMSKVALAAYQNRTLRSIVCLKELWFRCADGRVKHFVNTNKLLKMY